MNGRALLLKALRNEVTPRAAWLPFLGVHGGKLLGLSAKDYLKSALNIYRALKESYLLYKPDGLPVVFDLQVEAEVLGCELRWSDETPPAVTSHPLLKKRLADLPPFSLEKGRFPLIFEALRAMKQDCGKELALYGLITGPFTLASHLMGSSIFLAMYDEPEEVAATLAFCTEVARQTAAGYLRQGADVIAVVDPMTSQISPPHFDTFVAPYVNAVFESVRAQGGLSSLFVCGDATRNLERMCQTRCDNLSVDENIPLSLLKELAQKNGKSFGGNLKLTSVLLLGSEDDAKLNAVECLDTGGCKGYILAPGCDLPFGVPPSNLAAVAQMVHDNYQRDVARTTLRAKAADTFADIVLPDYAASAQVIADVITLDSTACAPCQYMLDAVQRAAARLPGAVVVREHKIKNRAGLGMMTRLGVKNIPAICLDGEALFISLIPDEKTLVSALEEKLHAKQAGAKG